MQYWQIYGYLFSKLKWAWQAVCLSHILLILKIYTTFKMFKWCWNDFLIISTGFKFSKIRGGGAVCSNGFYADICSQRQLGNFPYSFMYSGSQVQNFKRGQKNPSYFAFCLINVLNLISTRIYGHLRWPFFSPFGYGRVPELFRVTNIWNGNNSEGRTIFGRNDNNTERMTLIRNEWQ